MVSYFTTQSCEILNTVPVLDGDGNPTYNELGEPIIDDNNVVTTLDCRLDPVRFRSREVMGNSKTFVRELEYHQMVYTEWPENINPSAITNEMRMKLTNPATIGGDTQYFNIVSVNPVIAGTISHHLEIEVQKGYNV